MVYLRILATLKTTEFHVCLSNPFFHLPILKMPDTEKFAVKDVVSRYESFEFFARHQMALRHNLIQRRTKVSLSILQRGKHYYS